MRTVSRFGLLLVIMAIVLGSAAVVSAQGKAVGRVAGKVVDEDGKPVQGVVVTATCTELPSYEVKGETNKKGKFLFSHVDGTKVYQYRFDKEGYLSMVQNVKPNIGAVLSLDFVLLPPQAAAAAEGQPGTRSPMTGGNRAIMTYNQGAEAQEAGDLDLAERRFTEAVEIDPTLGPAHAALAGIAHQRGDYAKAAALAEKALEFDPANARALQIRYDAYRLAGDAEEAKNAAAALRDAGGSSEAAKRIFNEAADVFNSGDMATAKAMFQEAVTLDPELTRGYIILAGINLRQGNPAEAMAVAEKALEREPENVNALKLRYDAARALGDADTVKDALHRLGTIDPEWAATGLYDHAVELFNEGNQAGAAAALREVLKVRPDHAMAHYWLGMSLFNSGDSAAAKEHLTRFLELAPDDPEAPLAKEILGYIQ